MASATTANATTAEMAPSSSFELMQDIVEHTFPVEFIIAGELAQFETFAIPSISKLLHRTRQYEEHGLKRLDDTKANLYGIFLNPEGSTERQKMIDHLNWVHSHYTISNEDNIYTLLRLYFFPIEWIEKHGSRSLTSNEKSALVTELLKTGEAMNISDLPRTYDAMKIWQRSYRQQHESYHEDNAAVAQGMMEGLQAHFPQWTRGMVRSGIIALLRDKELLKSLGFKPANWFSKTCVNLGISLWKNYSRIHKPWRRKKFSDGWFVNYYPSYQGAFSYCKMGPDKLLNARQKQGGCPFH